MIEFLDKLQEQQIPDTKGPLRIELVGSRIYVIGNGNLIPVNSFEEGRQLITVLVKSKQDVF